MVIPPMVGVSKPGLSLSTMKPRIRPSSSATYTQAHSNQPQALGKTISLGTVFSKQSVLCVYSTMEVQKHLTLAHTMARSATGALVIQVLTPFRM